MDPNQLSSSRKCLQQAIDAEIKSESLEESIRVLKLRRNALSPVSSLPPEVFEVIFSVLCLPGASHLGKKSDHHLERLRVSHVSHQWREIALNQRLLWSHVDFTTLSLEGAAEILGRAKLAPLCLEASLSGRRRGKSVHANVRFSTFRKELQARISHIRQLRISADLALLFNTLKEIVSPAPTLEYLSLSSLRVSYPIREEHIFIFETLFNGSTPRLSCLKLHKCDISWKSPLLKGLRCLQIISPTTNTMPELAVWLDALDELSQLRTLTLHSASPDAPPFPFDVKRTVTLPYLTRLDISDHLRDCALALAHLDLPALTWLCLTATSGCLPKCSDVQKFLTYVAPHAHGPQDTRPLQSVVICCEQTHADILAWPVPDIDVGVHDPPTATPPTHMALSFRSQFGVAISDEGLKILDTLLAGFPLDGLVTLVSRVQGSNYYYEYNIPTQPFWLRRSQKWPLLRHVKLTPPSARGFIVMLLDDSGGCEWPLLPSLTELSMVDFSSYTLSSLPLCNALMQRADQGVPVKVLDLRLCDLHPDDPVEDWLRLLTEIGVDVIVPEKTCEEREPMKCMWETIARDEDGYSEE